MIAAWSFHPVETCNEAIHLLVVGPFDVGQVQLILGDVRCFVGQFTQGTNQIAACIFPKSNCDNDTDRGSDKTNDKASRHERDSRTEDAHAVVRIDAGKLRCISIAVAYGGQSVIIHENVRKTIGLQIKDFFAKLRIGVIRFFDRLKEQADFRFAPVVKHMLNLCKERLRL